MATSSAKGATSAGVSMLASAPAGGGPNRPAGRRQGSVSAAARRMNGDRGRAVQFRRAFHKCQVPMVMVDNHRRYLDANSGARLLFRLSLDELRRRQIENFTRPDELTRMGFMWRRLLAQGQVCGEYDVSFDDDSRLQIVFSALANVLPGEHLIVFAPADWPSEELGKADEPDGRPFTGRLSAREREVLSLMADGRTLSDIAERLTISVATVRTHAANMYRKLGARNGPHAVALGLRQGLIQPRGESSEDAWARA